MCLGQHISDLSLFFLVTECVWGWCVSDVCFFVVLFLVTECVWGGVFQGRGSSPLMRRWCWGPQWAVSSSSSWSSSPPSSPVAAVDDVVRKSKAFFDDAVVLLHMRYSLTPNPHPTLVH